MECRADWLTMSYLTVSDTYVRALYTETLAQRRSLFVLLPLRAVISSQADLGRNKKPLRVEGLENCEVVLRYCVLSVVTIPVGPAFSALAFLTAMVLSTQSSAVFRSALRASVSSHSYSARWR